MSSSSDDPSPGNTSQENSTSGTSFGQTSPSGTSFEQTSPSGTTIEQTLPLESEISSEKLLSNSSTFEQSLPEVTSLVQNSQEETSFDEFSSAKTSFEDTLPEESLFEHNFPGQTSVEQALYDESSVGQALTVQPSIWQASPSFSSSFNSTLNQSVPAETSLHQISPVENSLRQELIEEFLVQPSLPVVTLTERPSVAQFIPTGTLLYPILPIETLSEPSNVQTIPAETSLDPILTVDNSRRQFLPEESSFQQSLSVETLTGKPSVVQSIPAINSLYPILSKESSFRPSLSAETLTGRPSVVQSIPAITSLYPIFPEESSLQPSLPIETLTGSSVVQTIPAITSLYPILSVESSSRQHLPEDTLILPSLPIESLSGSSVIQTIPAEISLDPILPVEISHRQDLPEESLILPSLPIESLSRSSVIQTIPTEISLYPILPVEISQIQNLPEESLILPSVPIESLTRSSVIQTIPAEISLDPILPVEISQRQDLSEESLFQPRLRLETLKREPSVVQTSLGKSSLEQTLPVEIEEQSSEQVLSDDTSIFEINSFNQFLLVESLLEQAMSKPTSSEPSIPEKTFLQRDLQVESSPEETVLQRAAQVVSSPEETLPAQENMPTENAPAENGPVENSPKESTDKPTSNVKSTVDPLNDPDFAGGFHFSTNDDSTSDEDSNASTNSAIDNQEQIDTFDIVKEGWIMKWRNVINGFQLRWMVLYTEKIVFYLTAKYLSRTYGHIKLCDVKIQRESLYIFEIVVRDEIFIKIKTESELELHEWMAQIEITKCKSICQNKHIDSEEHYPWGDIFSEQSKVDKLLFDLNLANENIDSCNDILIQNFKNLYQVCGDIMHVKKSSECLLKKKEIQIEASSFLLSALAFLGSSGYFLKLAQLQDIKFKKLVEVNIGHKECLEYVVAKMAEEQNFLKGTIIEQVNTMNSSVARDRDYVKGHIKKRVFIPLRPSSLKNRLLFYYKVLSYKDYEKAPSTVPFKEPLSFLQKINKIYEYSGLLDKASALTSEYEQMCYVAAFVVSTYSAKASRAFAPFMPVCTETYELDRTVDYGWRSLTECICLNPLTIAHECEGKNWTLRITITKKNKFFETKYHKTVGDEFYLSFRPDGKERFYTWNQLSTFIKTNHRGKLWMEHYGDIAIKNLRSNCSCILKFFNSHVDNESPFKVLGAVKNVSGEPQWILNGLYDKVLEGARVLEHSRADDKIVVTANQPIVFWKKKGKESGIKMYYFSPFDCELNELEEEVAYTDSRHRPDVRAYEELDFYNANKLNKLIEAKQLHILTQQTFYVSLWFAKKPDSALVHINSYHSTGNYWKFKQKRAFEVYDFT